MKIAVCFSGLFRDNYKECIEKINWVFSDLDADFFYGTWKEQYESDSTELTPVRESFVTKYYDYPKKRYHCSMSDIYHHIKAYRFYEKHNWDISLLPSRLKNKPVKDIKRDIIQNITVTRRRSLQNFQHMAHALLVDDFVDPNKYDLIVRVRYDLFVYSDLKYHIKDFCEQVLEFGAPYGFYTFNDYDTMDEFINPTRTVTQCISLDCHDFMIIHRADMFDPKLVYNFYDRKMLRAAESGWYQVLCEPYKLFAAKVNGFVRMYRQHNDQNRVFKLYEEASAKGHRVESRFYKYNAPETMGVVVDDLRIE